ncbi:DUF5316 domain-containing protein [Maledivibacter halophilus]|uniref:Uncharacterized protein n=1 Tax=Maledivibacter halophilus TaxID=36842 RepID=A0A1T5M9W6_9FIRM|nr:DUF5316 domain-containing protein [Maledivibacter halophilus]SKC84893.1 hypothetical protein SAMN02194393_04285 [Maledivibacter halophilus]
MKKNKRLINRPFILGSLILIIVVIISLILNDWNIIITISGSLGSICFIIAAALLGVFVSANQQRANFNMTENKDRIKKNEIATYLFLLGTPNIIGAVIVIINSKR